ncbi:MAG: metallophosphoesterase [Bryobacteraceae bacterium]
MKLLVFSDIHSDLRALDRLLDIEADLYVAAGDLVSWSRGLDKAGEALKRKADKMFVLPGNHESPREIAEFCAKFGFTDFHGKSIERDGVHVAGLGCSSPTPFNTPGEYSETEFAARLTPFAQLEPLVLICHCPPKDTLLDQAGPTHHFGSTAIRDFIERRQPLWFFCGHIHEAEGVKQRIGVTTGVNVGKKGYLLDLDKLKEIPPKS